MDAEMLDFFVNEIKQIRKSISLTISSLIDSRLEDSEKFAEIGQMVDRIYGTAATLGLTDISEYAKVIKNMSYMASASENELGKAKVIKALIKYVEMSDKICDIISSGNSLDQIKRVLNIEKTKALLISDREFEEITTISCSIE